MTTQYRIPEFSTFEFQHNISNQVTNPTGSEAKGVRYLIKATAGGVFVGLETKIATASKTNPSLLSDWIIDTPTEGWMVWDNTANKYYAFNGSAWVAWDPAAGHAQNTYTGTTSATFLIDSGGTGVKLKDSSGALVVRNAADGADADLEAANLKTAGNLTDGSNSVTVAHVKATYDAIATYDASLAALTFNL
jgi:hypothetical protein